MLPESTDSTSRSLLRRARERDPAAWTRLSQIYSPLVYEWCRRAGLQEHDSADICQEVFRAVAAALDRFRKENPGDSFRGWLWRISHNKMRDHFRDLASRPDARGGTDAQLLLQRVPDMIPDDGEEDERAQSQLARRAIDLMQTDFEETTWRSFWLIEIEGYSPKAVAEQMNLSRATVYKSRSRVLRRLKEEFKDLELLD